MIKPEDSGTTGPADRVRDAILGDQRDFVELQDTLGIAIAAILVPILLWQHAPPARLLTWSALLMASVIGAVVHSSSDRGLFRLFWVWGSSLLWAVLPWLSSSLLDTANARWILVFIAVYGIASDVVYVPQTFSTNLYLLVCGYGTSYVTAFLVNGSLGPAMAVVFAAASLLAGGAAWANIVNRFVMQQLESEQRELRANQATRIDDLTGLGNRRSATEEVSRRVLSSTDPDQLIHCAFIDLDDFKKINDLFGYDAGDKAIVTAADAIFERLSGAWHISRFAGDEFVAIGTRALNKDEIAGLLDLEVVLDGPLGPEGHQQSLSIGTTSLAVEGLTANTLFREASDALRAAKRSGKRQVLSMTEQLRHETHALDQLAVDLQAALDAGEIVPHGQTVNNLRTHEVVGIELLARWRRSDGSTVMPDVFIPILESNGLGAELGRQMIRHAVEALNTLTRAGDTTTWMSVNLSAHSLYQKQLPSELQQLLATALFTPDRLVIEITETQHLNDSSPVWKATARRLRELGASLAIDDFGTGYSSISQLINLPFTHLKVDRALTEAATRSGASDLCAYVASFGHSRGMIPIAEGIENEAEREAMWSCGYEIGQGWLFHRAEALTDVLRPLTAAAAARPAVPPSEVQTKTTLRPAQELTADV